MAATASTWGSDRTIDIDVGRTYKVLMMESISQAAKKNFEDQGYSVTYYTKAISKEELLAIIPEFEVICIRSKTKLDKDVLEAAVNLSAIGCFCIGTNQVDLKVAKELAIPVFNSPYANSRSVAELIIGQMITLMRQLGDRNKEMHQGNWNKISKNCFEVRNKKLGIVGYGNIGRQLSVLAEAMGLEVFFYDVLPQLPMGNAKCLQTLDQLLTTCDIVTLHVPAEKQTEWMINKQKLALMKPGSYLLNASRGNVCVIEDCVEALESGHLAGAYFDVYPSEPSKNGFNFESRLLNLKNVTLTPHIGGSTEEAQVGIGIEVSRKLCRYLTRGCSVGAVNFPELELKECVGKVSRICNVHKNVPGALKQIMDILCKYNIHSQTLNTIDDIGYVIVIVDKELDVDVSVAIADLDISLKTRLCQE